MRVINEEVSFHQLRSFDTSVLQTPTLHKIKIWELIETTESIYVVIEFHFVLQIAVIL